jgi:hypothetical protein
MSRMRGALPPLPHYIFTAWCLVKHRDNFKFWTDGRTPPCHYMFLLCKGRIKSLATRTTRWCCVSARRLCGLDEYSGGRGLHEYECITFRHRRSSFPWNKLNECMSDCFNMWPQSARWRTLHYSASWPFWSGWHESPPLERFGVSFIHFTTSHPIFPKYEGRLKSSWTRLITPSWNFVEVRWRSLFRTTSLGTRCASYNPPPTCRKRAADRWSLRNFLPQSSISWLEKPRNRMGRDLDCLADVLMGSYRSTFSKTNTELIQISPHAISGLPQPRKGSSEARNFEVINGLEYVFEKWVERCKKCIACQGRYFEKETVIAPLQSSDSDQ